MHSAGRGVQHKHPSAITTSHKLLRSAVGAAKCTAPVPAGLPDSRGLSTASKPLTRQPRLRSQPLRQAASRAANHHTLLPPIGARAAVHHQPHRQPHTQL